MDSKGQCLFQGSPHCICTFPLGSQAGFRHQSFKNIFNKSRKHEEKYKFKEFFGIALDMNFLPGFLIQPRSDAGPDSSKHHRSIDNIHSIKFIGK